MKLDTLRQVEIPEGAVIHLRIAGPVPRAIAFGYDLLIRFTLYMGLMLVAGVTGAVLNPQLMQGFLLISIFLIEWFYPVYFEVRRNGQTPGKKNQGLQVVCASGHPVSLQESLIRNLLHTADFLPFAWLMGLGSMLLTSNAQRLGDLAAGTVVVYTTPPMQHRAQAPLDHAPLAPPTPLTRDEQHAIVSFSDRLSTWTPQRQTELADHLAPLTGRRGPDGRDRLLSMARWFQEGSER